MKRKFWILGAAALAGVMAAGMLAACGSRQTEGLEYTQTEDERGYFISKIVMLEHEEDPDYRLEVRIPESYEGKPVVGIGDGAFLGKTKISNVIIPESVTYIGASAFSGCTGLTEFTVPETITSLGDGAFSGCTGLESVTLSGSITEVGSGVFEGCSKLAEVNFGEGYTVIGDGMFKSCNALDAIDIPEGVTEIGADAFSGCMYLAEIGLPAGLVRIGEGAFENTYYYNQRGNWTQSVLYIGDYLIEATETLGGSYTVTDGTIGIADKAFEACALMTGVSFPASLREIGLFAFADCNGLEHIGVAAENARFSAEGDCLVDRTSHTLLLGCKNSVIPADVTAIGDHAFFGCTDLGAAQLPASLVSIGQAAFYGCENLGELTLPAGLQSIGSFAFARCGALEEIEIPAAVTEIPQDAFLDCGNLQTVILPAGLTIVHENAFAGCYQLSTLLFRGDEAAWKNVSVRGDENVTFSEADVYFFSAGAPAADGNFWHEEGGVPAIW